MRDLDLAALIRRNAARRLGRGKRLHLGRNAESIEKIGNGKLRRQQTLAPPRDHQSARRRPLQGLAHRCAGNAEMIGELPFAETSRRYIGYSFCRRLETSEIHVGCRGEIDEGRPHCDRLVQLLWIDLVERVVRSVMGVEIIQAVLAE